MLELRRKVDRALVIGWADIAIVTQLMIIDILEECAAECFDMEYRVEVDRSTGKFRVAGFQVEIGRFAKFHHDAAVD